MRPRHMLYSDATPIYGLDLTSLILLAGHLHQRLRPGPCYLGTTSRSLYLELRPKLSYLGTISMSPISTT